MRYATSGGGGGGDKPNNQTQPPDTYPYLGMWQDKKGPAAPRLHDNGEELGVDGAEGGVPRGLGHPDVVIALFPLQVGPEHVAEF